MLSGALERIGFLFPFLISDQYYLLFHTSDQNLQIKSHELVYFHPNPSFELAIPPLTRISPHSVIFTVYPLVLIPELCKSPSSYIGTSPITIFYLVTTTTTMHETNPTNSSNGYPTPRNLDHHPNIPLPPTKRNPRRNPQLP